MAIDGLNTWMSGSSAIDRSYPDLIAPGTDWFAAAGASGFKIYAGDLMYMPTDELQELFSYLKLNNIKLIVEAYLVPPGPGQSGEGMCPASDNADWIARVQALGGTIDVVQMDEALYTAHDVYGESLTTVAASVATSVSMIKAAFPNVQISDIEPFPSNSVADVKNWLGALNSVGVNLSSFAPDIQWSNGSLSTSLPSLEALSSMLHANGTDLGIIYNGNQSDLSGSAWAATAEQRIAAIAADPLIHVDTAIIQTWQPFPQAATPTNTCGTVANVTAEYTALEPLYQAGEISATPLSSYAFSAPVQCQVTSSISTLISGLTCGLGITDIINNSRIAIVLIDQSDSLYAEQQGKATVDGVGTNELVLSGNETDINAELATVSTTNPTATSDTLDIETFDGSGRIDDTQLTLVSAQLPTLSLPPPTLTLASASDCRVNGDEITNVATPTLTGAAPVDSTINLSVDGVVVGTAVVNNTGSWSYTLGTALADGAHIISATDTNVTENLSAPAVLAITVEPATVSSNIITIWASGQSIDPGTGSNTIQFLTGAGNDTLVVHRYSVNHVSGFEPDTDALDLRSLVAGTGINLTKDVAALSDYLTVVDQGTDALLSFGSGSHSGGHLVAVLQGLGTTVTNVNSLVAHGAVQIS